MGSRVKELGLRVYKGLGFCVRGLGFLKELGNSVVGDEGLEFEVRDVGGRVWGFGCEGRGSRFWK